jgi:lactocepin
LKLVAWQQKCPLLQEVVSFDTPQNIMAEVTVNEKTGKVNLNGTGEFSLELAEAYNEIYIRYTLDDPNTIYLLYFEKVVDNIPPMLRLPENKSAIRVDETEYILAGVTEPNAVVNVAGEEVSVNQDGTFVHKISLKYGENIIPVTATDAAGNITA